MSNPKRSRGVFSKIETEEDAILVVNESSIILFMMATLLFFSTYYNPAFIIAGLIYAVCGYFIRRNYSNRAAILLLAFNLLMVIVGFLNGTISYGSSDVQLAIPFFAAIRAMEATKKLKEMENAWEKEEAKTEG